MKLEWIFPNLRTMQKRLSVSANGHVEKHVVVLSMAKLHKNVYSVHLSSLFILCCLYMGNVAIDSLMVHTLIQFPVIMWHIYFSEWPSTWEVISEVLGLIYSFRSFNRVYFNLLFHISTMVFKMVFSFGFRLGNNLFGLGSSSPIFQSVSNISFLVL